MNWAIVTGGEICDNYVKKIIKERNFDKVIAVDAGLGELTCNQMLL